MKIRELHAQIEGPIQPQLLDTSQFVAGENTLPTIIDTERFKAAVKFALIHYLKTGSSLSLRKQ